MLYLSPLKLRQKGFEEMRLSGRDSNILSSHLWDTLYIGEDKSLTTSFEGLLSKIFSADHEGLSVFVKNDNAARKFFTYRSVCTMSVERKSADSRGRRIRF